MRDEVRDDLDRRLRCARGHLQATAQMIEHGENDLAVVHQLHAVQGALTQIQVRLLRVWLSEWSQPPANVQQIEHELSKVLKRQRQHGFSARH
jgi:DNA-binding FrmR family transcriptional regulator